jgi:hypothetical protein
MHHRRLLTDDEDGMDEVLNETDSSGYGIRVTSKYYMQIFDWTRGGSKQRDVQINTDQPLQYSFVFDYEQDKKAKIQEASKKRANDDVAVKNFVKEGLIRLLPSDKDQIIMRFENLADQFDGVGMPTFFINIQKYARELYMEVN